MKLLLKILYVIIGLAFVVCMVCLPAFLYLYASDFIVRDSQLLATLIIFGNVTGIAGIFILIRLDGYVLPKINQLNKPQYKRRLIWINQKQ